MNENGTPQSGENSLSQNEYAQELFSILKDNGRDTSGLVALLGHVEGMENYIKRAEDKISEMKSQLADMKEIQNHPVKTALTNAIKSLENKVAEVKVQLAELKQNIVEGCKSAVQAFKEKGISALDKLASFFHIKSGLQDWKKNIDGIIKTDDKTIAKIEAFAAEYHSAGRAMKNMARVLTGKPPIDAKKEAGRLAKTLAAPYKAQKAALTGLRKELDKAITKLEQLETTAATKQQRKPTIAEKIARGKERAAQRELERPTPERSKTAGLEV
jgi:predicted  nucleic acid-binding Zn-ribbon protein